MEHTWNGWVFTTFALPLYNIFGFVVSLFHMLPFCIKLLIISIYFWFDSIPKQFIAPTMQYFRPTVIQKVIFLAKQEMDRVVGLDIENIKANKKLLLLYYGKKDGWVPGRYYQELKKEIRDLDATIDEHNIAHAFVLKSSDLMAKIVREMIQKNRVV